jgi:hypothetical protein
MRSWLDPEPDVVDGRHDSDLLRAWLGEPSGDADARWRPRRPCESVRVDDLWDRLGAFA